jgi:hypothetical protein
VPGGVSDVGRLLGEKVAGELGSEPKFTVFGRRRIINELSDATVALRPMRADIGDGLGVKGPGDPLHEAAPEDLLLRFGLGDSRIVSSWFGAGGPGQRGA